MEANAFLKPVSIEKEIGPRKLLSLQALLYVFVLIPALDIPQFAQTQQGSPIVADSSNPTGQSTSAVFIDTTKLVGTPTNSVNNRIMNCLAAYTKCDASKDSGTIDGPVSIAQSGVTLILGSLTAPPPGGLNPPYGTQLLSVSGSNNDVSCAAGLEFRALRTRSA